MKMRRRYDIHFFADQSGQALVTLLFFIVIGITITSVATVILLNTVRTTTSFEQGSEAYYLAQSGVDAMFLQLLRNPSFAGSQSFSLDGGTVTVTITQGSPITILSTGQNGNYVRKIQAQTVYTNGRLTIQSWKEVQ